MDCIQDRHLSKRTNLMQRILIFSFVLIGLISLVLIFRTTQTAEPQETIEIQSKIILECPDQRRLRNIVISRNKTVRRPGMSLDDPRTQQSSCTL